MATIRNNNNIDPVKDSHVVMLRDIMLINPPFLYLNNKVSHARVIFTHTRFKSLPVVNKNGIYAGVLDKAVIVQEHITPHLKVESYINTNIKPLKDYEQLAVLKGSKHTGNPILPVVSVNEHLVGIIPNPGFLVDVLEDINRWAKSTAFDDCKALNAYGIIIINDDGEIICFNWNAEKILGIKGKEIYGIHINKVIHDSKLCEVVKKGQTYIKAKLMADHLILCTNRFPLYKGDTIVGALGIFEDISEKERLNERLRSLRGLNLEMVGILESINDGIVLVDNNGIVIRTNTSFEALSGLSANQILGMSCDYLAEQGCFSSVIVWEVMEKKKPVHVIENIKGRDSLVVARPIFDSSGKLIKIIVIMKDIFCLNELIMNLQLTKELASRYCIDLAPVHSRSEPEDMVAKSMAMRRVVSLAHKVAKVDSNVLVMGETGVGKEVVAKSVHNCSCRMNGPFIKLNCGAIPEPLLESELFGYESGAFTGAKKEGKAGLIELADGGTLFLDEVADLPLNLQVKLLRVLQEREVMRVGGIINKKVDFRLIAATSKNLEQMVKDNRFREDLFYRLNVVPVFIPPLRERKEDIVPLVIFFLNKFNKKYGLAKKISPEVIQSLLKYDWPGNIRELENTIERLVVTSDSNLIRMEELKENTRIDVISVDINDDFPKVLSKVLDDTEKNLFMKALKHFKTTREMAEALGISQSAVVKKMKKHSITRD